MKVGIIRHFKVDYKIIDNLMNSSEFEEYINGYDNAPIIKNEVLINRDEWNRCYCSDLPRAIKTAESVYYESLEITELLREVKMYPVLKTQVRVPSFLWSISSRIAWKLNHKSQLEASNDTINRAKEFLNRLDISKGENILIVSHGFFLLTLIQELNSLGFKGAVPKRIKNGYLYILEKKI